jgi:hypothetical protein
MVRSVLAVAFSAGMVFSAASALDLSWSSEPADAQVSSTTEAVPGDLSWSIAPPDLSWSSVQGDLSWSIGSPKGVAA